MNELPALIVAITGLVAAVGGVLGLFIHNRNHAPPPPPPEAKP